MNDKILVAYASAAGSTRGVAEALGQHLAVGGVAVDVRHVSEVTALVAYRAVIVGSAVRGGWLPEAIEFVRAHQRALSQVPTAVFLVCMTIVQGNGQHRDHVSSFLDPVRAMVKPVAEGFFAGCMRFKDHPFFRRLGLRFWFAVAGLQEGDHRDWAAIRAWADAIRPRLLAPATVEAPPVAGGQARDREGPPR
jgi:menaquinone-dependent protoporphyrinogen oxidase